jgi:hypothetical protein
MERVVLKSLGEPPRHRTAHPPMELLRLDERVAFLQASAIEKSSFKHYSTGMRSYARFCISHNLDLDPTPETLSRYIAYSSQFIGSAPKYLTGVRHFLRRFYPHFDSNRSNPLVQATIAGARKVRADPVRRKLPLRPVHLQMFVNLALQSQHYDDLLFATVLSCAFYACHRIGELVISNDKSLFDWRKVIKRASVSVTASHVHYHLPYHKSDRFFRGTHILLMRQATADPLVLMGSYLALRDFRHGVRRALFVREDGSFPNRTWFEKHLSRFVDKSYGGHSARAGGATFYASLGLSEDVIQALGRWSSSAWKDYIRDNPTVRAELQLVSLSRH